MNKQIVFFDIDGTLLDHNKELPASTKGAINTLQENGIYVAIATGRAPFMFESIRKELNIQSFVSYNGQYVVFEGEVIYKNMLNQTELTRLHNEALVNKHPMVFMGEEQMRASVSNHSFIQESMNSLKFAYPKEDASFYEKHPIFQSLLFCEEDKQQWYEKRYDAFEFIRWHEFSCDVLPKGGSKAVGISKIIQASGVDKNNVYAFGDGLNDMEMLHEAGVGVAMGNAVPDLKKVADYITESVDNDGIFLGLKHFGLL